MEAERKEQEARVLVSGLQADIQALQAQVLKIMSSVAGFDTICRCSTALLVHFPPPIYYPVSNIALIPN